MKWRYYLMYLLAKLKRKPCQDQTNDGDATSYVRDPVTRGGDGVKKAAL